MGPDPEAEFRARWRTALVLLPVVVAAATVASPGPALGLGFLAVLLAASEVAGVARGARAFAIAIACAAFAFVLVAAEAFPGALLSAPLAGLGAAGVLVGARSPGVTAGAMAAIVGLGLGALVGLKLLEAGGLAASADPGSWLRFGPSSLLMVLLPVWASDTAAIGAGRVWGRHRLAPRISPGKTWEGALAGLGAAVLVAMGAGLGQGYPPAFSLACGLFAGAVGPLGDLLESLFKRRFGAKDSGRLLPGHGGLLDRIDSLVAVAPFAAALFVLVRT